MRGWFLGLLAATLTMAMLVAVAWAPLAGLRFDPLAIPEDADDLVIPPGSRGFMDSLRTGPQRHRYDEGRNETTLLDEIWLGRRSFRFPVAAYDGRPSRDVAPERVRKLEIPHAFLFVRRGRGEAEGVVVKPGRTVVDGSWEVMLAPGEIAWVTVGPGGLAVEDRDVP